MDVDTYLSNKHVILSSGGTKLNDLYYHGLNSSASLVECTYSMGKYSTTLSSDGFGSTSNVQIPNQSFLGECYLELVIEDLKADVCLSRGWGYAIIQEISYLIGSSNTSTITLPGESCFTAVMAQCSDAEKRSEVFNLAGQAQLGPIPLVTNGPTLGNVFNKAYVLLPLPWSVMCDKIDFDTSLLSNNIIITIKFKQGSSIFGGSGVRPLKFQSAPTITFRQGDLSNTNLSLKHTMMQNPDLIYSYPMIHYSNGNSPSPSFTGRLPQSGLAACQMNIQGFLNSDLVGLYFYVVNEDYVSPTDSRPAQPFVTDQISNVRLYFNGIPLYLTDGELYKLVNMVGHQSASYYQNVVITGTSDLTFATFPGNSYICYIDFARVRAACYQNHFNNTFRISNQTLQLYFNTSLNQNVTYRCYYTMVYNGICELRNGQSFVYFD